LGHEVFYRCSAFQQTTSCKCGHGISSHVHTRKKITIEQCPYETYMAKNPQKNINTIETQIKEIQKEITKAMIMFDDKYSEFYYLEMVYCIIDVLNQRVITLESEKRQCELDLQTLESNTNITNDEKVKQREKLESEKNNKLEGLYIHKLQIDCFQKLNQVVLEEISKIKCNLIGERLREIQKK